MKKIVLSVSVLALIIHITALISSCEKKVGKLPPKVVTLCDTITFTKTIKPMIDRDCISCHDANSSSGDLTTYAGIKQKIDNGTFKNRVFDSPSNPMPQGAMYTQDKLDILKCWLDKGAPNE